MTTSTLKSLRYGIALLAGGLAWGAGAIPAQAQQFGQFREDPAEALARHLKTLGDQPQSLYALTGAGKAALELGDSQAALTFFARAEEVAPRDGRVKAGMGSAFLLMEKPLEAMRFFQEAKSLGVPDIEFAADRGLVHDLTGNPRLAQADYNLVLRHRDDAEVRRRLALSLAITGERDRALAAIDPLLRASDRSAWRVRAFVLALTGDLAGANRAAQDLMPGQALQMQPFLARLPGLTPAQRALAVHFGDMPANAQPVQATAASTPAIAPAARNAPATITTRARGRTAAAAPSGTEPARSDSVAPSWQERWGRSGARTERPRSSGQTLASRADSSQVTAKAPVPAPAVVASAAAAQRQPEPAASRPVIAAPVQSLSPATTTVQPVQAAPSVAPLRIATQTVAQAPAAVAEPVPQPLPAAASQPAATQPLATRIEDFSLPASQVAAPGLAPNPAPAAAQQPAMRGFGSIAALVAALPEAPAEEPVPVRPTAAPAQQSAAKPAQQRKLAEPAVKAAEKTDPAKKPAAKEDPKKSASKKDPKKAAGKEDPKKPGAKDDTKKSAAKDDPAKKEPSRIWIQIAGGANKAALPKEFDRLKDKAPKLLGSRSGWTTPLRATNRLLIGPFKTEKEAQALVNELNKLDMGAFSWTSPAGQEIEKLSAK